MSEATSAAGFGHGKIILLGEHAVVDGHCALAAGMTTGIRATIRSGSGTITIPAWSYTFDIDDAGKPAQAIRAIYSHFTQLSHLSEGRPALDPRTLDLHVDADIPPAAGLGSSAALATAVARAVAKHAGAPENAPAVAAAVAAAEGLFHGNPSGIDAAAAAGPAVGVFTRASGWRPLQIQSLKLCVGLSGKSRDTEAQVTAVSALCKRSKIASGALQLLGDAARAGEQALLVGNIDELGRLFDLAHGLLSALRVSSPELDAMVHAARAAGAIGAKLTGAGGGGAVIALAPSHSHDVLDRWNALGFKGFVTRIGDVNGDV